MRRFVLLATGALALAGLTAAVTPILSADNQKTTPKVSNSSDARPASVKSAFGFDLFKQMVKQDHGKNVFISPTSVSLALSMIYNGAEGQTRQAIAKTLKLDGISLQDANTANAALIANLTAPGSGIRLDIANSIWTRSGVNIRSEFVNANKNYYGAEVNALDFSDPAAVPLINVWVKKNTQGKIDKLIDQLDPASTMVLVDAVYFKGDWTEPFNPKFTRTDSFTLLDGKDKPVSMMSNAVQCKYYKGSNFSAVSIPYGKGAASMYIFLPDEGSSLDAFLDSLDSKSCEDWMSKLTDEKVFVMLPKFKIEYGTLLNDALTTMGMGNAFSKGANFSGIASTPLWISKVIHKTVLDVNEQGTEAAAATGTTMMTGPRPPKLTEFEVNRPFFCAVKDNKTGEFLFMGAIVDP